MTRYAEPWPPIQLRYHHALACAMVLEGKKTYSSVWLRDRLNKLFREADWDVHVDLCPDEPTFFEAGLRFHYIEWESIGAMCRIRLSPEGAQTRLDDLCAGLWVTEGGVWDPAFFRQLVREMIDAA